MVYIDTEGKINDNTYLIDAMLYKLPHQMSLYVIENKDERMLIDTGSALAASKIFRRLKEFNLLPIHKLFLTHSHWDHTQGYERLKKKIGEFETLASAKAIENLKNPEKINKVYNYEADPIENVTPLKEGDIIDLNGLELEVFDFFGHTQDHIALLDKKNRNLFAGDGIINMYDRETFSPTFMPPDFNETELLKTFQKLRNLKDNLDSISLDHFGLWKDEDFDLIVNKMEDAHFKTKNAMIEWYNENNDIAYITSKYHEIFTPNSTIHTKENMLGLELIISWLIEGLKISGFIK
ncbi:MAG: MBL fold metallo-hydrolase [Candidatus Lokiarchaeota archaeon]|nr:MBL fold metallo-hydrolase [Candidatus Lokiarchaeota archaeon]